MGGSAQLADVLAARWPAIGEQRVLLALPDGPVSGAAFLSGMGRLRARLRSASCVPQADSGEPLAAAETSSAAAALLLAHAALAEGWAFSVWSPDWPPAYARRARARAVPWLELSEAELLGCLSGHYAEPELPLAAPRQVPGTVLSHVLFTSGSTGAPRAIATERRALASHLAVLDAEFPPDRGHVTLQLAPPHTDASLRDLLFPSLGPGQLVPGARRGARVDIIGVADQVVTHRVTRILSVLPSVLFEIATQLSERGRQAPEVRCIAVSGELLTRRTVSAVRRAFPAASIVNQYGPSETTMTATRVTIEPDSGDSSGGAGVGGPFPGYRVRVADQAGASLPASVSGTVLIGGTGIARGYAGEPRATAAAFVPDPAAHGGREYDTGDIGALQPDGSLMLLGRADDQVKVLGHKFGLSAIAAALESLPAVRRAAAIALPSPAQQLVAFVVARNGSGDSAQIQRELADVLPYWMLPGAIRVLPELPVLGNGKLDRDALLRAATTSAPAQPVQALAAPALAARAPGGSDELTEAIRGIWGRLLRRQDFADTDDFFVMGGNSLLALRAISECKTLVPGLTVKQFFRAPTIESICSLRGEL